MPDAVFRAPKGTQDILAPESARWIELVGAFASQVGRAGYGLHIAPTFEHYEVFARVGEATDIVRKEMYDFEDRGGRHIALRPEGTASVVRAFLEHRPTTPFKVWYVAPSFRNEAPQAGRYRQHHQVGVEALGTDDPAIDVEVIALLDAFLRSLGLTRLSMQLNSLGDARCRPAYLVELRAHLLRHERELTEQSRQTLSVNPLRVLDSKRAEDREVVSSAPVMVEQLCGSCAEHFESVKEGLASLGVRWTLAPRLVRGLDYYTRTTFEIAADALDTAQNALGGGGRYDGLAEQMGGPPTPGIGFGCGIERTLLACDAEGVLPAPASNVDVFVIDTTGGSHALALTHELRAAGVRSDRGFDNRSMKSQMKQADRAGASIALIVGSAESSDGVVTLRDLRSGDQDVVARSEVVERVTKVLGR